MNFTRLTYLRVLFFHRCMEHLAYLMYKQEESSFRYSVLQEMQANTESIRRRKRRERK
ncbi:hypothetical protein [Glutamicibacter ardleyensis]|uniref:hypothetical protein n=1 Tax=Glutamicibacter ardleyensis TaxID=225894 RepID=UPI003FD06060